MQIPAGLSLARGQELDLNVWNGVVIFRFICQDGVFRLLSTTVESGRLKCPFDPLQPFTSVLTGKVTLVYLISHAAAFLLHLQIKHVFISA